jgi:hypothetical protein
VRGRGRGTTYAELEAPTEREREREREHIQSRGQKKDPIIDLLLPFLNI